MVIFNKFVNDYCNTDYAPLKGAINSEKIEDFFWNYQKRGVKFQFSKIPAIQLKKTPFNYYLESPKDNTSKRILELILAEREVKKKQVDSTLGYCLREMCRVQHQLPYKIEGNAVYFAGFDEVSLNGNKDAFISDVTKLLNINNEAISLRGGFIRKLWEKSLRPLKLLEDRNWSIKTNPLGDSSRENLKSWQLLQFYQDANIRIPSEIEKYFVEEGLLQIERSEELTPEQQKVYDQIKSAKIDLLNGKY